MKYLIIGPGVQSDDFNLTSPVTDAASTLALALASAGTGRFVVKALPAGAVGDVTGPGSSTADAIARFVGTSGKVITDASAVTLEAAGVFHFNTGSGGLILPNGPSAAIGNVLNFHRSTSFPQTWTGPWAVNQVSTSVVERTGNWVDVDLGLGSSLNNGAGAAVITATAALPNFALPLAPRHGTVIIMAGGVFAVGAWAVNPVGIITISATANPTATFAVGSTGVSGMPLGSIRFFIG